jgi:molybdate-binding protein
MAPANPERVRKAEDLKGQNVRVVNRESGPGRRAYRARTTQPVARAFGSDFPPRHTERYDLVMRKPTADFASVKSFLDVLQRAALRRKLEVPARYNTLGTGVVVAERCRLERH